jgi:hypothetical protein
MMAVGLVYPQACALFVVVIGPRAVTSHIAGRPAPCLRLCPTLNLCYGALQAVDIDCSSSEEWSHTKLPATHSHRPVLRLVSPVCILAGPVTATYDIRLAIEQEGQAKAGQCVKVFARHMGRFLGSSPNPNYPSFSSMRACSVFDLHALDDGSGLISHTITLHAPSCQGLVAIELESSDRRLMSNWKPVRLCCAVLCCAVLCCAVLFLHGRKHTLLYGLFDDHCLPPEQQPAAACTNTNSNRK